MTEQRGSRDGTSERGEVRYNVVDRRDKSLVQDVRDSNEETAREGHRQQKADHGRSLADASRRTALLLDRGGRSVALELRVDSTTKSMDGERDGVAHGWIRSGLRSVDERARAIKDGGADHSVAVVNLELQ